MKTGFILFLLVLLTSCSSSRMERKISDASWDSLADETYIRWGETRLKNEANSSHAVVKCHQGEIKETLDIYRKEYLARKEDRYYWHHIGNCYFIQEKWTKAEFFYNMALDESKIPTLKSIALNNLALIHFKFEQWDEGRELLKKSIGLAPKFKVPRYNLSQLYLQFGLYDKAIETLNDPLFRGQKDIDVYFSLANAYLYKGDLKTSGDYFNLIPKEQFRREDIAATYSLFLIRQGDIKGARVVMQDRDRSGIAEITEISQKIEGILLQKMSEE